MTAHRAAGQQKLGYTAFVENLHGQKRREVRHTVIKINQSKLQTMQCSESEVEAPKHVA